MGETGLAANYQSAASTLVTEGEKKPAVRYQNLVKRPPSNVALQHINIMILESNVQ